ncbi:MAG: outer membrane beta-barrel protein [Terracidiphilus sp.]|jgi:hypothetical protein
MKNFLNFVRAWDGMSRLRRCRPVFFPAVLGVVCLGLTPPAQAQVESTASRGGLKLSAGGTASAYQLGYGEVKLLGASAFVDADSPRHIGIEGEARWLTFHYDSDADRPGADETAKTYMIGPRYSRDYGRFQPYLKALVGIGQFNYPYNFAKETDLVVAPGGGVDYRLTHRIRWRAVDFEYQIWPKFTYGLMSSYGLSTGILIKIR